MKTVEKKRYTLETEVEIRLDLTGEWLEENVINTGIGFLDHMLELFAFHSGIKLQVEARGDLEVDYHHTVEDIGITLGEALDEALEDRRGMARYGEATIPMEEALTQVVIDLAKRPYFVFLVNFPTEKIGSFDVELIEEFLRALVVNGRFTLHVRNFYGKNSHHIAESIFKALAHAFRKALTPLSQEVFSTKGTL
ncbi:MULTISPECIES: imidazoleglycerol-phosphate dehydratase HisB [Thermodesulfobacterium]|jgi:imidazoleglycerol-phosphate dehydratase|uniref:Imidazoleglycerol-phosphate dehydratase n=2 Tax=Thermodesulfobacterium commune TaxID=1741 RepID=A0A075WTC8_9BACT|nr:MULTISPECIES: imidazoleglycerol-phosphate dehydratase HisB [Thermodesulfobacterium]KUJ97668.1 MAG: Imidazoleglycerol-phosphate dehydratase [Thermodesulfobacterium sp. 37_54]KUK19442.1 MAG: Imidazoleglycerol-phosphate dehydratase [Thermodesulfobacterium commune]AIH04265.1 imidazoleglycerol-phosphate dehydratase [Thermodesulfobacterium commune DSM 2178]KUK37583.1 MAG: Imidazoleglycerol-phosphate dehydratase [Thermodesulfobacterium commune]MBZ4682534.1 imidazoleglycerol-phosphate dehydratase [